MRGRGEEKHLVISKGVVYISTVMKKEDRGDKVM